MSLVFGIASWLDEVVVADKIIICDGCEREWRSTHRLGERAAFGMKVCVGEIFINKSYSACAGCVEKLVLGVSKREADLFYYPQTYSRASTGGKRMRVVGGRLGFACFSD